MSRDKTKISVEELSATLRLMGLSVHDRAVGAHGFHVRQPLGGAGGNRPVKYAKTLTVDYRFGGGTVVTSRDLCEDDSFAEIVRHFDWLVAKASQYGLSAERSGAVVHIQRTSGGSQ